MKRYLKWMWFAKYIGSIDAFRGPIENDENIKIDKKQTVDCFLEPEINWFLNFYHFIQALIKIGLIFYRWVPSWFLCSLMYLNHFKPHIFIIFYLPFTHQNCRSSNQNLLNSSLDSRWWSIYNTDSKRSNTQQQSWYRKRSNRITSVTLTFWPSPRERQGKKGGGGREPTLLRKSWLMSHHSSYRACC